MRQAVADHSLKIFVTKWWLWEGLSTHFSDKTSAQVWNSSFSFLVSVKDLSVGKSENRCAVLLSKKPSSPQ
jgi:hypothetical protein